MSANLEKKMWSFRKQMRNFVESVDVDQLPEDEAVTANTMISLVNNSYDSLEISLNALFDLVDQCKKQEVCHG